MKKQHRAGPVTLATLIRNGQWMWTYCDPLGGGCGHEKDIDPRTLPLDPSEPVPGLGRRHMRCSQCGSRSIVTTPEIVPGGVVAARARRRGENR